MGKETLTVKEVADAVYAERGFLFYAAKRLGVDPKTIRNYAKKHETVRDAITQARENSKDLAESRMLERIDEGDMSAIIFYLKTQAKDRGYVERQEMTGAEGGKLAFEVILGNPAHSSTDGN